MQSIPEFYVIELPDQAVVLLNPLRSEILNRLTEPASAAEVARMINEAPQRVNYHLKTLEKVGLVKRVGTRQVRNLVEVLYQAIARSFVLADSLGWNADSVQQMKDQGSLAHLITTSERIKKDALLLLEQSDANVVIPSATLQMQVKLGNQEERTAFVDEYVALVKQLVEKYQAGKENEAAYQVVLAVYPEVERGGEKV